MKKTIHGIGLFLSVCLIFALLCLASCGGPVAREFRADGLSVTLTDQYVSATTQELRDTANDFCFYDGSTGTACYGSHFTGEEMEALGADANATTTEFAQFLVDLNDFPSEVSYSQIADASHFVYILGNDSGEFYVYNMVVRGAGLMWVISYSFPADQQQTYEPIVTSTFASIHFYT